MSEPFIALVPAYEPEPVLLTLLAQLRMAGFEVILVDDGSGPAFSTLFQQATAYATILTHAANAGKGAALKTGMAHIQSVWGLDRITVTVDADGQHRVEDALRLCREAQCHPEALILGSRELQERVPLRSRLGNTVTRGVYQLSTGLRVHDTQTGLRAFHGRLLPRLLEIPGTRYEYEMNVLLEFARQKIPIREVTIATVYINQNAASHFDTLRDSFRIYKDILKFSVSSFVGFLVDYFLYGLLLFATSNLLLSNIGARLVSASVNYTINRKLVFQSHNPMVKSALQYFLLAAVILLGNTLVLDLLVTICQIHQMLAKLLTEMVFFTLSWIVQRCLIFQKKG